MPNFSTPREETQYRIIHLQARNLCLKINSRWSYLNCGTWNTSRTRPIHRTTCADSRTPRAKAYCWQALTRILLAAHREWLIRHCCIMYELCQRQEPIKAYATTSITTIKRTTYICGHEFSGIFFKTVIGKPIRIRYDRYVLHANASSTNR